MLWSATKSHIKENHLMLNLVENSDIYIKEGTCIILIIHQYIMSKYKKNRHFPRENVKK